MSEPNREERKFDPARAHLLDAPERDAYLPDAAIVDLLELDGGETVLDYGAGTGRVALAAAARLPRGRVVAVNSIFVSSSNELGAFESGLAARLMGTVLSVVVGGGATLLTVLLVWRRSRTLFSVRLL